MNNNKNVIHPIVRIMAKVVVNEATGCWEFGGTVDVYGYGGLKVGKSKKRVHRLTYEHYKGTIPEGLQIDHLCRNRACCNPDHLEAVTSQENIRRGLAPAVASALMNDAWADPVRRGKMTKRLVERQAKVHVCKHCGVSGQGSVMARWHGDRCRTQSIDA